MKGDIVKIKNPDEVQRRLRTEIDGRARSRLIFLNAMANHGLCYEEASAIFEMCLSTGYVWIRKWNKGGYDALKDQDTRTGRPPRLSQANMIKLQEILKNKSYWTTREVVSEIKTHFSVDLSDDQVINILRNKFKMLFSKPYPMDYRRPTNAEEVLDNQLNLVLSLLKEEGIREEEIALGFIDEARPQNTANTVKVRSFFFLKAVCPLCCKISAESHVKSRRAVNEITSSYSFTRFNN